MFKHFAASAVLAAGIFATSLAAAADRITIELKDGPVVIELNDKAPEHAARIKALAEAARVREAYVMQYSEIFTITAVVCVVGAVLGLLIAARREHAEEPAESAADQQRSSPRPIS